MLVLSIEHFRDLCSTPSLLRAAIHPAKFLAERNSSSAVVNSQDSKQREAAKWHSGLMTHYRASPWETYGLNSGIVTSENWFTNLGPRWTIVLVLDLLRCCPNFLPAGARAGRLLVTVKLACRIEGGNWPTVFLILIAAGISFSQA